MPTITSTLSAGTQRIQLPSGGQKAGDVSVTIDGAASTDFAIVGGGSAIDLTTPLAKASAVAVTFVDHRTASSAATNLLSGGINR